MPTKSPSRVKKVMYFIFYNSNGVGLWKGANGNGLKNVLREFRAYFCLLESFLLYRVICMNGKIWIMHYRFMKWYKGLRIPKFRYGVMNTEKNMLGLQGFWFMGGGLTWLPTFVCYWRMNLRWILWCPRMDLRSFCKQREDLSLSLSLDSLALVYWIPALIAPITNYKAALL